VTGKLVAEPENLPRMPDQQADVMPGSPLAVLALVTEIVRARFTNGDLAWRWTDNPTPEATEDNTETGARKVLIEPAFSEGDEVRNFRPAIFIDKQETIPNKVAVGNFAGAVLRKGLRAFYSIATIPIDIEVISDKKGESAILADIVWFYLLAGREQIQATFGLQDMSNPVLGRTVSQEADKRTWVTHITFTLNIGFRWSTIPISPVLREIVTKYYASGETNVDAFLLKTFIR
jgi:hypothetical protein